ncbi:MAG: hypothetical protein ACQESP_12520 [Candidatus Muiribacteriota bacterium]
MDKLKWCLQQDKGIKLIEPNNRLAKVYLHESKVDMGDIQKSSPKWKNIVGYYACYNALYALLQKIGIKCEIHDCSIELMDCIGLSDYKEFMIQLKKIRIDVQYYLKKPKQLDQKKVTDFVLECKVLFNSLSDTKIKEIRETIVKVA